jgi:putative transcriptional regulator
MDVAMDSPLKAKFLIASPALMDPNFARSVVLIVTHDDSGAMGVIINRPLPMTVGEAWKQVSEIPYENEAHLHQGGPCEGMLMVLHGQPQYDQFSVLPGVYLSTDSDTVRQLVEIDESPMKFVVGYAGWSAGQLEDEIARGGWVIAPAGAHEIFHTPGDLWARLLKEMAAAHGRPNIDPRLIPPDPSVN